MKRKWLSFGIILLFVGTCIIPAIAQETEKTLPSPRGNWLYVGGSGPGNYTRIQDAINDSHDNDTVFVYDDSSPYNENLTIDKSIMLFGENRDTTVLAELNGTIIINITSERVYISGFTIKQSTNFSTAIAIHADSTQIVTNRFIAKPLPKPFIIFYGIIAQGANNLTFMNNEFRENVSAVNLKDSHSSVIKNNSITYGDYAVNLIDCYDTIITNNRINESFNCIVIYGGARSIISNNTINLGKVTGDWWNRHYIYVSSQFGIYLSQPDAIITDNLINDCEAGIYSRLANQSYFARNEITQCYYGLLNVGTFHCTFVDNDFHQNTNKQFSILCIKNRYIHNYWGRPRLLPKPIFGYLPFVQFDWRPALLPQ
jgi:nitrous oxidase accessory protein NosD